MDRGVIATATELYEARHYPSVVATVTDALEDEPTCVPLLVLRARAHIGLRRDLDAQADLRDIIRLDPQCGIAYRLLGELAARRDENESAAIFFREAIRLDPEDREATDWLAIVDSTLQPRNRRASSPTMIGAFRPSEKPIERARTATDNDPAPRTLSSPARVSRPTNVGRFARGTHPPDDDGPTQRMGSLVREDLEGPTDHEADRMARSERKTQRFARGSTPSGNPVWKTPTPMIMPLAPAPVTAPVPPVTTITGRPPTQPPAKAAPRLAHLTTRPMSRGPTPELPGFGDYLVSTGILTRERLRAAQAYQRSMKVQLSTAIVTLGLATPQRIEWASVSHQSQLAHDRQQQG